MNGWKTTFDAAAEPFHWGNAGEGLAALALVALGIALSLALRQRRVRGATGVLALACGVAVFFAVRTLDHLGEHDACVAAARRGEGELVEGKVERLRRSGAAWPWSATQEIEVGGRQIDYPVLAGGCGFSGRDEHAGELRQGATVRLRVWHDQILKVELRRATGASERGAPAP